MFPRAEIHTTSRKPAIAAPRESDKNPKMLKNSFSNLSFGLLLLAGAFFTGCGGESAPKPDAEGGSGASHSGGNGVTEGSGGSFAGTGGSPTGASGGGAPDGTGGQASTGTPYAFVGSTDGQLRAFRISPDTGALTAAGSGDVGNLDFFTMAPDLKSIFVTAKNSLSVHTYDAATQSFAPGASTSTQGGGAHVTLDATGTAAFVAHYGENLLSFFTYSASGGFSAEQTFPAGSRVHQARMSPDQKRLYVPCLGSDYVAQYDFDAMGGTLTASTPASETAPGGPRHMDFHPTLPVAYVLTELESDVHVYDMSADTGLLSQRGASSIATNEDEAGHGSSDIKVHPAGTHLYAINRDEPNELVYFSIDANGDLTREGSLPSTGRVRSFGIDPKGKFLIAGGADGLLTTFLLDNGIPSQGPQLEDLGNIHNTEIHYLPVD